MLLLHLVFLFPPFSLNRKKELGQSSSQVSAGCLSFPFPPSQSPLHFSQFALSVFLSPNATRV
jgi:hypothetical protein